MSNQSFSRGFFTTWGVLAAVGFFLVVIPLLVCSGCATGVLWTSAELAEEINVELEKQKAADAKRAAEKAEQEKQPAAASDQPAEEPKTESDDQPAENSDPESEAPANQ